MVGIETRTALTKLLGGNTKIIRDQQKNPLTVDVRTGAKLPRNLSLSRLAQ